MKKTLLFLALAATSLSTTAQQVVSQSRKTATAPMKGVVQPAAFKIDAAPTRTFGTKARITTQNPSVQVYRPAGVFWLTQTYDSQFAPNGLAFGPANASLVFTGKFSGEESKWIFATAKDETETFIVQEQAVAPADSTLTLAFEPGLYPAPMGVSTSKVGTNALTAKTVSDTASFATSGLLIGLNSNKILEKQDRSPVDMPVGNYDPSVYLASIPTVDLFGVNNETSAQALANAFGGAAQGIISARTLAAVEFFPMNPEAKALLHGFAATIYSEEGAPTENDLGLAVGPIDANGRLREPVAVFLIDNVTEALKDRDNKLIGYGVHFTPTNGIPWLIEGQSFYAQIVNMQGSNYSWAPVTTVTVDTGDGDYGYVLVELTRKNADQEVKSVVLQTTNVYNWGNPSYINPSLGVSCYMSYDQDEIEAFQTGIATPKTEQAAGVKSGTFDLQGRRVSKAVKGLYIENGKKVLK